MLQALVLGCASPSSPAPDPPRSILLDVQGVPPQARFVQVRHRIDFTARLRALGLEGAVDERSLRLFRDGIEVPVQYVPDPQPRAPVRTLLPGSRDGLSLAGEYAPDRTPAVAQSGELVWIAASDGLYRLDYRLPRQGLQIQVSFPPQNLLAYGPDGRPSPPARFPRVQLRPSRPVDGVVHVTVDGRPLTSAHDGRGARKPYLYPVLGPAGHPLTDLGKPHDPTGSHAHHLSLWVGHGSAGGKDFWSMGGGTIVQEAVELQEDGPLFGVLRTRLAWTHGEKAILRERRTWTFHATSPSFRLMDLELELSPPGDAPVVLGPTSFGLLSVRVAPTMTVVDGAGEITDAEGRVNERAVHLGRAAWIDLSGPVGPGERAGVALMDHPSNPGHPTAWHCRDDGWASAAVSKEGPVTIQPGTPLRLRYRVVLHRGGAREADVAAHFADFAAAPLVRESEGK